MPCPTNTLNTSARFFPVLKRLTFRGFFSTFFCPHAAFSIVFARPHVPIFILKRNDLFSFLPPVHTYPTKRISTCHALEFVGLCFQISIIKRNKHRFSKLNVFGDHFYHWENIENYAVWFAQAWFSYVREFLEDSSFLPLKSSRATTGAMVVYMSWYFALLCLFSFKDN